MRTAYSVGIYGIFMIATYTELIILHIFCISICMFDAPSNNLRHRNVAIFVQRIRADAVARWAELDIHGQLTLLLSVCHFTHGLPGLSLCRQKILLHINNTTRNKRENYNAQLKVKRLKP